MTEVKMTPEAVKDYLDNLDGFIHDPEHLGFDLDIIPVAMWLRGFMPGDDEQSGYNHTSLDIKAIMCDIVDVDLNDIARLMVLNGYSLCNTNSLQPRWCMKPIERELTATLLDTEP